MRNSQLTNKFCCKKKKAAFYNFTISHLNRLEGLFHYQTKIHETKFEMTIKNNKKYQKILRKCQKKKHDIFVIWP